MPTDFGEVLTGSIFINGDPRPIGWTGIQTVSTLLDEDIRDYQPPIRMEYDKEMSFDCDFKLSKSAFKLLFLGWRAKGPYRKRLIEKMKKAFPWHNFTFELRSDET